MKRFKIILAAIVFVACSFESFGQPAFSGGNGSQGNPYRISSWRDLVALSAWVRSGTSDAHHCTGKYFKQTNNINMAGAGKFIPIGGLNSAATAADVNRYFNGKFDGDIYVLRDLVINFGYESPTNYDPNDPTAVFAGLFGLIGGGAEIRSVKLFRAAINVYNNAGSIVGTAMNGALIDRCWVAYSVISVNNHCGGILGASLGATVRNSGMIYGSVTSFLHHASGIVAADSNRRGMIENCYVVGTKIRAQSAVSGIAEQAAFIRNCYFAGEVHKNNSLPNRQGPISCSPTSTSKCYYINTWKEGWSGGEYFNPGDNSRTEAQMYLSAFVDEINLQSDHPANPFQLASDWSIVGKYPTLGYEPKVIKNGETVFLRRSYVTTPIDPAVIILEDGGNFINLSNVNKDVIVEHNLKDRRYICIGSVFGNSTAEDYFEATPDCANNVTLTSDYMTHPKVSLLQFNYEKNMWSDGNGGYSYMGLRSPMVAGRGYLSYVLDTLHLSNTGTTAILSKHGTVFNEESLSVSIDNNGPFATDESSLAYHWYILSNPYPAGIFANKFIAQNSSLISSNYVYTYDGTSFTTRNTVTDTIKHGEGFWVAGTNTPTLKNFYFNKNMLYSSATEPPAKSAMNSPKIKINVTNENGFEKECYIKLNAQASNGLDRDDAFKLFSFTSDLHEPYFVIDSTEIAINSISVLPYECGLNVFGYSAGKVKIDFSDVPDDVKVTFIDGGQEYEVSTGFEYQTEINTGVVDNRFKVRLEKSEEENSLISLEDNNIDLWIAGRQLNINGENLGGVEVYNVLGQVVYSKTLSGNAFSTSLNLASGAYTAKATGRNNAKTIKFVINK